MCILYQVTNHCNTQWAGKTKHHFSESLSENVTHSRMSCILESKRSRSRPRVSLEEELILHHLPSWDTCCKILLQYEEKQRDLLPIPIMTRFTAQSTFSFPLRIVHHLFGRFLLHFLLHF